MKMLHITAVALCAAAVAASAQTIQVSKENRTISVTATDKVTAVADTATVHIGFIVYGPTSDAAYASGSRTSNAIVKALTAAGVPPASIESENQSIQPVQNYQVEKLTDAEKAQRKFQVTQSWTIRTSANDASKVLDTAVKAGANQSGQIDWSFRDENAPAAQAAAKALKRAQAQAEQMAQSLNAKLGELLYASNEAQPGPIRPFMRAMA